MAPKALCDRLLTPRSRFDPEVEAPPLPESSLPLPRWQDLPLDAKFPVTPAPKGELTFVTTKLCQPAYRSQQRVTFDLTDPYNRQIQSDYNALTDPNIRSWLAKPENKKHIRSQNLVTEHGQIPCNIREFNNYRKYVRHQALLNSREKEEALEKAAERRKKILQETRAKAELVGAEVRYRVIRAQHRAKELEDEKKKKLAEKQVAEARRQAEREREEHFKRQERFCKNSIKLEDKQQDMRCKEDVKRRHSVEKQTNKLEHDVATNNNHTNFVRERQAAFEAKKREKWENKRIHQEKLLEDAKRRRERAQEQIRAYRCERSEIIRFNEMKTNEEGELLENEHRTSRVDDSPRTSQISTVKNNKSRKSFQLRKEVENVKRANGPSSEVAKCASQWVVEEVLHEQDLSREAARITSSHRYSDKHVGILDGALSNALRDMILTSATSPEQEQLSEIIHMVVRTIQNDDTPDLADLVAKLETVDASRETEELCKVIMGAVPDGCKHTVEGHTSHDDSQKGETFRSSWTADPDITKIEFDLREFLDVLQQEPMKPSELKYVLRACLQLASRETIDDVETIDKDIPTKMATHEKNHDRSGNNCPMEPEQNNLTAPWSIEKQLPTTQMSTANFPEWGMDVAEQARREEDYTGSQGHDRDNTSADLLDVDLVDDTAISKPSRSTDIIYSQGNFNTNFNKNADDVYTSEEDCGDSLKSSRLSSPGSSDCEESQCNASDKRKSPASRPRRNRGRLSREGSISPNKSYDGFGDAMCHGDCDSRDGRGSTIKTRRSTRVSSDSSSDGETNTGRRHEERLSPVPARHNSHSSQSSCSHRRSSKKAPPSRSISHRSDSNRSFSDGSESINSLNPPMNTVAEFTDDATSASSFESDDEAPTVRENKVYTRRFGGSVVTLSRRMLRRIQDRCKPHENRFPQTRLHRFIALSASRLWRTSLFPDSTCTQSSDDNINVSSEIGPLLTSFRSRCLPKDCIRAMTRRISAVLISGLGDNLERYLTDGVVRAMMFRFYKDLRKNVVDSRIVCNVLNCIVSVFHAFRTSDVDFQVNSFFIERLSIVLENLSSYTPTANRQMMESLGCAGPESSIDSLDTYYGNWRMISHKAMSVLRLDLLTPAEKRNLKDMLVNLGAELLFSEGVNDPQDVIELIDYRGRDQRFRIKSSLIMSAHLISKLLGKAKDCNITNATLLPGAKLGFHLHSSTNTHTSDAPCDAKPLMFFMLLNDLCKQLEDRSFSVCFIRLFATYIKDMLFGSTLVTIDSDVLWMEVKKLISCLKKRGKSCDDAGRIMSCAMRAKLEDIIYTKRSKTLKRLNEAHYSSLKLLLSEAISAFMNSILHKLGDVTFTHLQSPTKLLDISALLAQEAKAALITLREHMQASFPGDNPEYDWFEVTSQSVIKYHDHVQQLHKERHECVDTVDTLIRTLTSVNEGDNAQMYVPSVETFNIGPRGRRGFGVPCVNLGEVKMNNPISATATGSDGKDKETIQAEHQHLDNTNALDTENTSALQNTASYKEDENVRELGEEVIQHMRSELVKASSDVLACMFKTYNSPTADRLSATVHLLEILVSKFCLRLSELRESLIKGKLTGDQMLPFLFYTTPSDTKGIHPDNLSIHDAVKVVTSVLLELDDIQASLRQASRLVEAIHRAVHTSTDAGQEREQIFGTTSAITLSQLVWSVLTSLCHSVICLATASPTLEVMSKISFPSHPITSERDKNIVEFAISIVHAMVNSHWRVVESEFDKNGVWLPSNIAGSGENAVFASTLVPQIFENMDAYIQRLKRLLLNNESCNSSDDLYVKLCSGSNSGHKLKTPKVETQCTPELINRIMLQLFSSIRHHSKYNNRPPLKINNFISICSREIINDSFLQSKLSMTPRQKPHFQYKAAMCGEGQLQSIYAVALNDISENIQTKLAGVVLSISKALKTQVGAALFVNGNYDAKLRGAACLDALHEKIKSDVGRHKVAVVPAKIESVKKCVSTDNEKHGTYVDTNLSSPTIMTIYDYMKHLFSTTIDMAGKTMKDVAQFSKAISDACHLVNLDTMDIRHNLKLLVNDSAGDIEVLLVEILRSALHKMTTHQQRKLVEPRQGRSRRRKPDMNYTKHHQLSVTRTRRTSATKAKLSPYIGDISDRWKRVSDLQRDVWNRKHRISESCCSRTESVVTGTKNDYDRSGSYPDKNKNKRPSEVSNEGSNVKSISKNVKKTPVGLTKETTVYSFVQDNCLPTSQRRHVSKRKQHENGAKREHVNAKGLSNLTTICPSGNHDENDTLDDISHDNMPLDPRKLEALAGNRSNVCCNKKSTPLEMKAEQSQLSKLTMTKTSSIRAGQHGRSIKLDVFQQDEVHIVETVRQQDEVSKCDSVTCIDMKKEEDVMQFPDEILAWQGDDCIDQKVTPVIFKLLERELPLEIFVLQRCLKNCPLENIKPANLVDFIVTIDHLLSRREEATKRSSSKDGNGLRVEIDKAAMVEELNMCTGVSQRAAGAVHNLLRNVEAGRLNPSDLEALLPSDEQCRHFVEHGQDFVHDLATGLLSMVEKVEICNQVPQLFIDNPDELIRAMDAAAAELAMGSDSRRSNIMRETCKHPSRSESPCPDDYAHTLDESMMHTPFPDTHGQQECNRNDVTESPCKHPGHDGRKPEQAEPVVTDSDGYLISNSECVNGARVPSKSENDGYIMSKDEEGDSVLSIHMKPGRCYSETSLGAEECANDFSNLKCFKMSRGDTRHIEEDMPGAPLREAMIDRYESAMWEKHVVNDNGRDATSTGISVAVEDQVERHLDHDGDAKNDAFGAPKKPDVQLFQEEDNNCSLPKQDGRHSVTSRESSSWSSGASGFVEPAHASPLPSARDSVESCLFGSDSHSD